MTWQTKRVVSSLFQHVSLIIINILKLRNTSINGSDTNAFVAFMYEGQTTNKRRLDLHKAHQYVQ